MFVKDKHKVYDYVLNEIDSKKGLVFVVIDPPNQEPNVSGKIAKIAEQKGVTAIAVGGSVGAQGALLEDTIQEIKENCSLPVILFPGNIATVSKKADAIYFMTLLNSNDPYYLAGAQISSAYSLKRMNLEVIPTSYIIVEPGRAAGWIGSAKLIPRELPYLAGITALAGQYMGSKFSILESGGGAPEPVPVEMIAYTKKLIDIPLIIAGGVRTPEYALRTIKAGADIVHVGTAVEEQNGKPADIEKKIFSIVSAVQTASKFKK
ncbi:MAG: geranylgeranylglyceryl/heptaprenylglyceryl phosphate synthase [Candidatus Diapherotrites archaeon]|nr:geranylgeranylglyceryl/heptaprenylglyceryl phosphate synthase [Candidatus Diapherotrites archaeon]